MARIHIHGHSEWLSGPCSTQSNEIRGKKIGRYHWGNSSKGRMRHCTTAARRSTPFTRLTAEFQVNDRAACVSQASQTAGNATADTRHLENSPTPPQVMWMSSLEPCIVFFVLSLRCVVKKKKKKTSLMQKTGWRKVEDGSVQLCTSEVMKQPTVGDRCERSMDKYWVSSLKKKKRKWTQADSSHNIARVGRLCTGCWA